MNRAPLRTVLIDDNPDDRALVIRALRREFPQLTAEEITDQESFDRVLELVPFDLVITDFQLRWTDGVTALRRIKSRWPECPVVMFTGTGSEEVAVEAMKSGLDDYVLKSPQHYARLPAVAKMALKMSRQRHQIRQAEARHLALFATVPVGLFCATPEGKLLDVNPAFVQMLRYPDQASLLNKNLGELFAKPTDYKAWRARMERHAVARNYEAQFRTHQNDARWAVINSRAIAEPQTRRELYEGSIEDATERKRAEDERERLILELQDALATVKSLSGLLPICASCKRIRDEAGSWNQIEAFIQSHSDAEFTHSFCPECMQRLYPEASPGAQGAPQPDPSS
jgi:PAS domain S-box-containing protein